MKSGRFMNLWKRKHMMTALVLALMIPLTACQAGASAEELSDKETIEATLNLANNEQQEWTYSANADAWVLSVVQAVAYPELPDQQGVSVCVPGAYVTGIDTDGDGDADVTSATYSEPARGVLVIDYDAQITSTHGQVYTAATAPIILNTGAAGYGSQNNSLASTIYAAEGYINVACGNRGKQDTVTDENGNAYYTGDVPSCLVDQKAAARYVKYNILLGNLPGDIERLVSTGGSGGGAHAAMFAATSNNPDFYDYQIAAGAVGVYRNADGSYSTTVTIDGKEVELSDGAWGCVAYSAITSLYEADMALAFEYTLDADYDFSTPFQKQLASYLSEAYMDYINAQELFAQEASVGFDLNGDGDLDDTIALTIECDPEAYPETNGYHGTYLDLYLAEFRSNLQWYLNNLGYAEGWTWFDADGNALSDEAVAAMTAQDKAAAFIEGRYAKGSTGGRGGFDGMPSGMGGAADFGGPDGGFPEGGLPGGKDFRGGFGKDGPGGMPNGFDGGLPDGGPDGNLPNGGPRGGMIVGTPDGGTTQSATGRRDSMNYETYAQMVESYREDIEEIEAGDAYGKNIVALYNPLNYIGADGTTDPIWTRIVMGASEGDMSMFSSLNLQLAWLNADVDAVIEWQWDGGHVPSEIFGESLALYVDQMVAKHGDGVAVEKAAPTAQTTNGTATQPTGTDLSGWVNADDVAAVSFTLADAAAYRTKGASKAMPGFDVIDYGQEDYVFGSAEKDARHWTRFLLEILEEHADTLEPLFNAN